MPCNLGYKSYDAVRFPTPKPSQFKKKVSAPQPNSELLRLIGEEDEVFLEWLNSLDIKPLLAEALRRAMSKVKVPKSLNFSINIDGSLVMTSSYTNKKVKNDLELASQAVGDRYQMEILGVIAQLLGYKFILYSNKNGALVLEGEKEQSGVNVNAYLKITKEPDGDGSLMFEHFRSPKERDVERAKLISLAQKMGIKISLGEHRESGKPISADAHHKHFLKEGEGSGS